MLQAVLAAASLTCVGKGSGECRSTPGGRGEDSGQWAGVEWGVTDQVCEGQGHAFFFFPSCAHSLWIEAVIVMCTQWQCSGGVRIPEVRPKI